MQPRILILTNRVPYPLSDGGALAMRQVMDGYRRQGWAVYALMMNASRQFVPETDIRREFASLSGYRAVPVRTDITAAGVLRNLLFSRLPNHARRFYHPSFATAIREAVDEFRPDFIQVESVFLGEYLPLIRKAGVPVVLRMHNVEHQIWRRLAGGTAHPLKKAYLRNMAARMKRYEEKAWSTYDALLPITQYDAEVAAPFSSPGRIHIVPFGIGTPPRPSPNDGEWQAYHLGAMDWLPNVEAVEWFLREAWPLVHAQHPGFRISFAGRQMPQHLLETDIPGVSITGYVPDAHAFISDKKVLVVPLRSGGGLRVKILEAMAAGRIVVSTDTGIQGIDAVAGVHYLAADTGAAFAAAIDWCLNNREEAAAIGQNAAILVQERYDAKAIASGLAAFLLEIRAGR